MNVDVTGAKILFTLPFFGGIKFTETVVNSWIIIAAITLLCVWLTRGLQVRPTTKRQVVVEYLYNMLSNFVKANMGEKFMYFVPFIAALFSLSAFSSLSSLICMQPPTADLSTTLGWSLLVFALITFYKIKTNGFLGYLKGYTQPIVVLTPFNLISEVATPVSMAFRHFGNIASGGVITALIYGALAALSTGLLGWLPGFLGTIPLFQLGIPAALSIYFDVFSSFAQAFIFCMLTMLYIASAAETDEA
ncbi:MAG: FoF1 ATP synthase subunit a [Oscillospiraceae bacterium]